MKILEFVDRNAFGCFLLAMFTIGCMADAISEIAKAFGGCK